jgi:hypothetical protein
VGFRAGVYAVVLGLVGWFLARPLLRRVTDQQVALYIEEHEPELQAAIVSAIDADSPEARAAHRLSPALVRKVVELAVEKCREIDYGRALARPTYRRSSVAIAGLLAGAAALMLFGPAYLRHAAMALLLPAESLEAASPYHIAVTPGDATVARGSDVTVKAALSGFDADEADVYTRRSPNAPFERMPLAAGAAPGQFEGIVLDLQGATDYFVQAAGVPRRSPRCRPPTCRTSARSSSCCASRPTRASSRRPWSTAATWGG